ncbi:MAG: TonB-dependent receptor [Flavobacteriaceae bacterium]|nr:TonB-dependent receptor [Flavobacteriaceae bacterium]
MNKKSLLIGCLALIGASISAQTETNNLLDSTKVNLLEEAVVSGTRFKIPIEKSGKTIYKISAKEIENNAGKTVVDLLNEVPGIQMEGNFGSPGTNISLYQRGGRNKNTLILIDGIPLNDPSGINSSYDLRLLSLNAIESIEVLNGGLSSLYGTGASSGVISITLKKSVKDDVNGSVDLNYGSYNTVVTSGNINGKSNNFDYMVSANYSTSDGFSSASDENSPTPFEDDGFNQKNALAKIGYAFNSKFKLDGIVAFDDFESDYDGGVFVDQDNQTKGDMLRFGLTPTFKYDKGSIQLTSMFITNNREFISLYPTSYQGKNLQLDLNQKHKFNTVITGLWGVNSQTFSYKQKDVLDFDDTEFSLLDAYGSLFYDNKGLNIHVGGRLNTHSVYDSKFIYNVNPSYLFKISDNTKFKVLASAATSYITPTGYQLYSNYGNTDLQPEESFNLEFGGSLYLNQKFTLNAVYFNRKEESAIDFVSIFDSSGNWTGGEYINLDATRDVTGFEVDFSYLISEKATIAGNYSHAEADDPTTFYRIPNDKFGASVSLSMIKNNTITAKYNYTGSRTIFDYSSYSELELDSFGLFDLYVQQKIFNKKVTAYGAVNNLLDTDFVSVYGFTTRGINFNIGASYNF